MNSLQKLKDNMARGLYGMTKQEAIMQGICIQCKEPPTFYSDAGRDEYQISGLCEPCFDDICKEK